LAFDLLTGEARGQLREILSRCVVGAAEIVSLLVAVALHGLLDEAAKRVLHDMPSFLKFIRVFFGLGFVVVYCQLVANFVAVWVPRLGWLKGETGGSHERKSAPGDNRPA